MRFAETVMPLLPNSRRGLHIPGATGGTSQSVSDCFLRDTRTVLRYSDRVEEELSAMNKRLDQLFSLLVPVQPVSPNAHTAGPQNEYDALANQSDSPFDLPSKLLGNSSVMHVLGLDADFAQALIRGERAAGPKGHGGGGTRTLIVHHRHAVRWVEENITNDSN